MIHERFSYNRLSADRQTDTPRGAHCSANGNGPNNAVECFAYSTSFHEGLAAKAALMRPTCE
jgi:hypothetical protein